MTSDPAEGTGALDKALDVLDAVAAAPGGLSQAALTQQLALPRSTAYRLLSTLIARGLLRRDATNKVVRLGFRCVEMARQAYALPDLTAAAASELRTLRDLTGETTYLATLDGTEVMSLERFDGAHSQRSAAALGQRKPLHCTSQGKAILSAMQADARDALLRQLTLKPLTPHTITDRRRLQAELRITAARGWSMDDEEIVLGVRCVGAPVVDSGGAVRGAISIAGPAWRMTRERAELLGPEVADAARRIGAQLGTGAAQPTGDAGVRPVEGRWAFEGAFPRLCVATGAVYWADTLAPALHVARGGVRAQPPTGHAADAARNGLAADGDGADDMLVELEHPITGLAFRGEDLLVAHAAGALRVTRDGRTAPVSTWPGARLLALCNAPDGTPWAAFAAGGSGSVIGPVRAGGQFDAVWTLDDVVQALAWNPTQDSLYATAPGAGSVLVLREGTATARRLATLPRGSGRPSGLAVDAQGAVWTALRDGWSVVRLAADGTLDRVVGLPVPCPTDVALAGERLFITTARQSVPLDALENAPLSGRLLVADV